MSDAYQHAAHRLSEDTLHLLRRADGFLDLRMLDRAHRELENIPVAERSNLVCERVALRLAHEQEDWPRVAELAERHAEVSPDDWGLWVQWAYAKRRTGCIADAQPILMQAWDRFPRVAIIPYNLACYACCERKLDKARDLLSRAFALDDSYRELALEDRDLEPLWPELGGQAE